MAAKEKKYKLRSIEDYIRRDLVFMNNPVLVTGLGLAPVIMGAVTLKNALILSVGVAVLCTPVRFLGNLLVGYLPQRLRAMVYSLMAAGMFIPCLMLEHRLFGYNINNFVGLYLPLLAVDAIIISRTEIPGRETVWDSIRNGVVTSLGFALVICIVGSVREILFYGSIYGHELSWLPARLPIAGVACGGFIIVGLLAALWQWLISVIKRSIYRGRSV